MITHIPTATQYQYMFVDNFLVALNLSNTNADSVGNDIRNGIYLQIHLIHS